MQPLPQSALADLRAGRRSLPCAVLSQLVELGVDARLAGLDLALQHVVARQRLLQSEQVLVTPVALKTGRDSRRTGLAAAVTVAGQHLAVPLAGHDRAHDRLAGLAHDVAQHVVQLHVHLQERLLNVLHRPAAVADELRALARIRTHRTQEVRRPERAAQLHTGSRPKAAPPALRLEAG